jgi:hypothetical protein
MGKALSTTGNKHHTPCLIGVAFSPLNPNAQHLVMGSSAEENDGVPVSWAGGLLRGVMLRTPGVLGAVGDALAHLWRGLRQSA